MARLNATGAILKSSKQIEVEISGAEIVIVPNEVTETNRNSSYKVVR